jgi:hypothetical protein
LRSTFDKLGVWSRLELAMLSQATAARIGSGADGLATGSRCGKLMV